MLALSNLRVRSNLLSTNYQHELSIISVFEARDVKRRNPNLGVDHRLTAEQQKAWRDSLYWGQRRVSLAEDGRDAWCESLLGRIPSAIETFEERPQLEDAFELLVVISQLARASVSSFQQDAVVWERRVRKVLTTRDEFGFTNDMIDQRLEQFLGDPVAKLESAELEQKAEIDVDDHTGDSVDANSFCSDVDSPPSEGDATKCSELPTEALATADSDPDLIRLCRCWSDLPSHIKATIVTLIDAVNKNC
jgi:hypothetical protein